MVALRAEDVVVVGVAVDAAPSLGPVLQDHLDSFDELLPHVFFGEVTRWAVLRYEDALDDREVASVLDLLEREFASGRATELIAASFLENLPRSDQSGAGIRQRLGPQLTRYLTEHLG